MQLNKEADLGHLHRNSSCRGSVWAFSTHSTIIHTQTKRRLSSPMQGRLCHSHGPCHVNSSHPHRTSFVWGFLQSPQFPVPGQSFVEKFHTSSSVLATFSLIWRDTCAKQLKGGIHDLDSWFQRALPIVTRQAWQSSKHGTPRKAEIKRGDSQCSAALWPFPYCFYLVSPPIPWNEVVHTEDRS